MPTSAINQYSTNVIEPVFDAARSYQTAQAVRFPASTTLAAGTILGEVSATPGTYAAYLSTHTDGTQNPVGILKRAVTTDSTGNITNWDEWGTPHAHATMFLEGMFRIQDLVGLDANAVTALKAVIVEGALGGNGLIRI